MTPVQILIIQSVVAVSMIIIVCGYDGRLITREEAIKIIKKRNSTNTTDYLHTNHTLDAYTKYRK